MEKEQTPVAPYGVFQIVADGKVVDYGIGVIHSSDRLVTFQNYFDETRKIGRIFFKKLSENVVFPLSYDLSQEKHADYIVINADTTQNLAGNKFVDIVLENDIENTPKFLSKAVINQIDSGKVGYAIGFDKRKQKNFLLHKTKFQLDSHIMDLRLKYQPAILFVFKQNQQYCYGFYEDSEDKSQGCDLYLSEELLAPAEAQGQAFIPNNKVQAVQDPSSKAPYASVGIIKTPGGRGTAQLLKNQKGSKYLITCAHNFVGEYLDNGKIVEYNNLNTLPGYSFELPKYNIFRPLRYKMQRLNNFRIKNAYIPKEYLDYFSVPRQQRPQAKQLVFPAIGNIPEIREQVSINILHDIAIVQLEENLAETHGFAIDDQKPITGAVQVSGFPEGIKIGVQFGIIEGNMYTESTASHQNDPSYVRFSNESNGDILLLHKLSTLPGNSGSAIYERISSSKCHLLAIHTTGVPSKQSSLYGVYNFGTYIHSKKIKSWLTSVLKQ